MSETDDLVRELQTLQVRTMQQNKELLEILAEIRDTLQVFREFVLEVTPRDAQEEIVKLT
jgi:uncharacterized protein (DUF1778 family)